MSFYILFHFLRLKIPSAKIVNFDKTETNNNMIFDKTETNNDTVFDKTETNLDQHFMTLNLRVYQLKCK